MSDSSLPPLSSSLSAPAGRRGLRGYVPALAAGLVAAVVAAALTWALAPRRYEATVTMLLASSPDPLASALTAQAGSALPGILGGNGGAGDSYLVILGSRSLRERVVELVPGAAQLAPDARQAADALAKLVQPRKLGSNGLEISVECRGPSPLGLSWGGLPAAQAAQLSADLANGFAQALGGHLVAGVTANTTFLRQKRAEVIKQLQANDDQLERLQASSTVLDPEGASSTYATRNSELEAACAEGLVELDGAQRGLALVRAQLGNTTVFRQASEVVARNPVVAALAQQLADKRVELTTALANGATDGHPEVQDLRVVIASLQRELAATVPQIRAQLTRDVNPTHTDLAARVVDLQVQVAAGRARVSALRGQLAKSQADLSGLPVVMRRFAELRRERESLEALLKTVTDRLDLSTIEEQRQAHDKLEVLDAARPPARPSPAGVVQSGLVAFLLGLAAWLIGLRPPVAAKSAGG